MGQVRNFVRNGWLYDTDRIRVATTQCVMENTKGEKKWLLMPWDNHPNNDANSIFADKILKVINSSKRPFNPKIEIINKKSNPQEYIYPLY